MKNFARVAFFLFLPAAYIFLIYFFGNQGNIIGGVFILVGGCYFARVLSNPRDNVLDQNLKNAQLANAVLKEALKGRGLNSVSTGVNSSLFDVFSSLWVALLFFAIGLMLYLDEYIFFSGDFFRFAIVNLFQYFLFLVSSMVVFFKIFKGEK